MRIIKKYKNRRLYDTELSVYITIENLQQYVLDGIAFKVIDAATNKDLTNATLLQILVEMHAVNSDFLSTELLKQLITLAQHPLSQTYKSMMEHWLGALKI